MIVHKSECNVVDAELEQHHAGLATPRLVPGAAEQRGDRRTLHGTVLVLGRDVRCRDALLVHGFTEAPKAFSPTTLVDPVRRYQIIDRPDSPERTAKTRDLGPASETNLIGTNEVPSLTIIPSHHRLNEHRDRL